MGSPIDHCQSTPAGGRDRGHSDFPSCRPDHWLAALERIVENKGLVDHGALTARKAEWADAYRTPRKSWHLTITLALPRE
jgi:hypothetical protein